MDQEESPLKFPCRFPIKAMGLAQHDIHTIIMQIVSKHTSGVSEQDINKRESSNGKYISITVTIDAHSREQLDAIYYALTAHEHILMAL